MKFAAIPALVLCALFPTLQSASAGAYIQGIVQWMDTDYDNSTGFGGRLGYAFDEMNAIELEFTQTDLRSINTTYTFEGEDIPVQGKADISTILFNYRFTYPLTERFRVLAGAGLGATIAQLDVTTRFGTGDGTNAVFTAQGFAGIEYFILPQLSVSGAFRLIMFDDFTYTGSDFELTVDPGNGQVLELGVSYYF